MNLLSRASPQLYYNSRKDDGRTEKRTSIKLKDRMKEKGKRRKDCNLNGYFKWDAFMVSYAYRLEITNIYVHYNLHVFRVTCMCTL